MWYSVNQMMGCRITTHAVRTNEIMKGIIDGIGMPCHDLHQHPAVGGGRERLRKLELSQLSCGPSPPHGI